MWRGHWRFLLPYRSGCLYEFALTRARSRARKKFSLSIHREEQRRVLEAIFHFFRSLYNPEGLKELIRSGGAPLICAIVGDQIGYWIGRSAGAALYRREDSFFFRRSHLHRAHDFYEKYGGRAVILARFVPIVRTFCPPVAGAAQMPYARYVAFDICGGILWVGAMILGGYALGHSVPNIGQRIHYVIAVVILLSILPVIISLARARRAAPVPRTEEK